MAPLTDDAVYRARLLHIQMIIASAWAAFTVFYLLKGHQRVVATDGLACLATIAVYLYTRGCDSHRRMRLAGHITLGVSVIGLLAASVVNGQARSNAPWFMACVPLFAASLHSRRSAVAWSLVCASAITGLHVSELWLELPYEFQTTNTETGVSRVMLVAIMLGFALSSRNMHDGFLNAVRDRNRRLELAQSTISEREQETSAARARLRACVDTLREGVVLVDPSRHVVLTNPSTCALLNAEPSTIEGALAKDALGKPFADLAVDRAAFTALFDRVSSGERTVVEHELPLRDGRTLEVDTIPVRFDAGVGRVWSFRDVSHRTAVSRLKSEFVSTVSHELRTPLTSIRGSLGLIEGGAAGEVSPQAMQLVRIGRENTDRLVRLINDLLDLQRIEAGKLEFRRAPVMLEEVIAESVRGIEGIARTAEVTLEVPLPDKPVVVLGERDRLVQVTTNLLSNAIKFSEPGDSVFVSLDRTLRSARVTVRDQGPGIAADDLVRVFGRFQQVDASDTRAEGGTGLGLAIAKAIVEEHGGRIGAESVLREGASFWFTLPVL